LSCLLGDRPKQGEIQRVAYSHFFLFFLTKSDRKGKHPNITGQGTNGMLAYPEDYCTDINGK